MSFKKIMLSGVAALAITSASAFGVTLENDGTGDYLLLPATYSNESGWKTDLKVVNTNTTIAIVARVVIRNGHDSSELFDFPLYLTPGDAWMGTLQIGSGANADRIVVTTTDDSSMLWAGETGTIIQASETTPLELTVQNVDPQLDVENQTTQVTDGRRSTYVEVFGLAAYDAANLATAQGVAWSEGQPLDKTAMFEYVRDVVSGTPKTQLLSPGPLNDLYGDAMDVDNESLLAKEVIVNDAGTLNMAMNAVAMGDVSTAARTVTVIGTATTMNSMSNIPLQATDEMRALLSKDKVFMMNEGANGQAYYQRLHLTDPIKKYTAEAGDLDLYYQEDVIAPIITDYYYTYNHNGRDMSEKLACAPEGSNTDFSNDGFAATDCLPTDVYYEVQQKNITPTSSELPYFFKDGGYIQVDLDTNTSVVPTSFGSTGLANYYIANQYEEGTIEEN